jgi:chemotaxis protein methyltransferase CheR
MSEVTEEQYQLLCAHLYRETGMAIPEGKRYFIERRTAERIAATKATNFASYFAYLRAHASTELAPFINAFTVNETYFYREDYQLRCLTRDLLRSRLAVKPAGESLRLWSLPCSTGEEPFSLAVWLLENWPEVDRHDVEIIGSDIDTDVLHAAQQGVYGKRALMRLDDKLVAKYFERIADDSWRIIPDLRQSVAFSAVNVMDERETRVHGRFDVIFCRNMLIYFDDASRRVAAENLFEALRPGGYLCLGHAESMSRISALFEVRRYEDAIVDQRPMETKRG